LIGLSEQDRRLLGQITRQDDLPVNARKLHVKSINDGYYAPLRKRLFTTPAGDVPIEVACLQDTVVTPRGFIIHEDNLIWDAHTIGPNWQAGGESIFLVDELAANNLGGYDPFNQTINYWESQNPEYAGGEFFAFNAVLSAVNFAHFVHDTLLQIPTFHECTIEFPRLRPFLPGVAQGLPVVEDMLKLTLGHHHGRRVCGSGHFWKIDQLFVPTPHLNDATQRISTAAMRRMRSLIDISLSHHPTTTAEDLFIARISSSRGQFEAQSTNYAQLVELLERRGFKTVDASALFGNSYFEQFRQGRIFIGLHGAGLLNVMLAPHGRLIELATPGPPSWVEERFKVMATTANIPFVKVHPKMVSGLTLQLDIPAIDDAISAMREQRA
jgi:hypothetical protein